MLDPRILASLGRRGDSIVAHINPQEAAILKLLGGSGTVNPKTGLTEFWDDGGNDPGGVGGEAGSGAAGGPGNDSGSGYGPGVDAYGEAQGVGVDGLSAENQANLAAILSDMHSTAQMNNSIKDGFFSDPMAYSSALAGNLGKGARAGYENFSYDPFGYTIEALTPSAKTIGTVIGANSPVPFGGLIGNYIGGLYDEYGFTAPEMKSDDVSPYGGDFGALASNLVSGDTQQQTASTASSFDRDAFGQYGQGLINNQFKQQKSESKGNAANRGMGSDSGQNTAQMAILNQQRQQKLSEFQRTMGDPNMGYNDLASSLMNILA